MADKKMCKIVQKIDFENKRETEKLVEIIKETKFYCKKCGRVANDKELLCRPEKI